MKEEATIVVLSQRHHLGEVVQFKGTRKKEASAAQDEPADPQESRRLAIRLLSLGAAAADA